MDMPLHLSIHQLMDILVVSTLEILWTMMLWRFVYTFFHGSAYSSVKCAFRHGIAESHVYLILNLLRNCQRVSKVAASSLHSQKASSFCKTEPKLQSYPFVELLDSKNNLNMIQMCFPMSTWVWHWISNYL